MQNPIFTQPFQPVMPPKRSLSRFQILTGRRFNRLVVYSIYGKQGKHYTWLCKCDCGQFVVATSSNLTRGHTNSCGCFLKDRCSETNSTHGEARRKSRSPELVAFRNAKSRCENPNGPNYERYGGRGIEFRFDSFEQFLSELGRKPSPEHSLDRINNNGHYEVGNVRWAVSSQQNDNKSSNAVLSVNGETKSVTQWAKELGLPRKFLWSRIRRSGWCDACAVSLPRGGQCEHKPTTPDVMVDKVREYLK